MPTFSIHDDLGIVFFWAKDNETLYDNQRENLE